MNKYSYKLLISVLLFFIICDFKAAYAVTNLKSADQYLYKASIAMTQGEKDYYTDKAKELYTIEYEKNNLNLDAMVGLGKAYSLSDQRADAKNILMQAYNTYPNKPQIQAALGDFNYSFQDYNTALEFYKLALCSGYLRDYKTNLSTALCYEKLGDIKNAKLYYKITLILNQNATEAKIRLSQLENIINVTNQSSQKTIFQNGTDSEDPDINTLIDNSKDIH